MSSGTLSNQKPSPAGLSPLGSALEGLTRAAFSGSLHIKGNPGGTIYLREGLIVAAATPAAPGPESLLLRGGRVSEDAWNLAYTAGAPAGRLGDELVAQGAIGAAGLEVICLSALFDAVFAMALFHVESCQADRRDSVPPPLLPVEPGVTADRLIRDLSRRLESAGGWRESGVTPHCRPVAIAAIAAPDIHANRLYQSVLTKANGRRTPRDMAFALGQGLFVVLQAVAALAADDRLDVSAQAAPPAPAARPEQSSKLPYRRKGTSKVNQVLPPSQPVLPLRPRQSSKGTTETES